MGAFSTIFVTCEMPFPRAREAAYQTKHDLEEPTDNWMPEYVIQSDETLWRLRRHGDDTAGPRKINFTGTIDMLGEIDDGCIEWEAAFVDGKLKKLRPTSFDNAVARLTDYVRCVHCGHVIRFPRPENKAGTNWLGLPSRCPGCKKH